MQAKKNNSKSTMTDDQFDSYVDKADFSDAIAHGTKMPGRKGRKRIGSKVTVTLPDALIERLRRSADKKAIAYQTLIRMIVAENIEKY